MCTPIVNSVVVVLSFWREKGWLGLLCRLWQWSTRGIRVWQCDERGALMIWDDGDIAGSYRDGFVDAAGDDE